MNVWAVIGSICAMIIGLWKMIGRKARQRRANLDQAKKLYNEGVEENDVSKITAGLTRIKRNS